jgi:hypothetical protein
MGCSVTFLLVRRQLDLLRLGPSPEQKDVEIAVLRLKGARSRFSSLERRNRSGHLAMP